MGIDSALAADQMIAANDAMIESDARTAAEAVAALDREIAALNSYMTTLDLSTEAGQQARIEAELQIGVLQQQRVAAATSSNSLTAFGGALNGLAITAGEALQTVRNYGITASSTAAEISRRNEQLEQYAQNFNNPEWWRQNYVEGSFRTGTDYIPRDGFIAELHKGEMVIPAETSKQLRNLGAANRNIGTGQQLPVAPQRSDTDGLREELAAIRTEIEIMNKEAKAMGSMTNRNLESIASNAARRTQLAREVERSQDRLERKLSNR